MFRKMGQLERKAKAAGKTEIWTSKSLSAPRGGVATSGQVGAMNSGRSANRAHEVCCRQDRDQHQRISPKRKRRRPFIVSAQQRPQIVVRLHHSSQQRAASPEPPKKDIGFHVKETKARYRTRPGHQRRDFQRIAGRKPGS
jgi:hypothetical protein